jgi:methyl-accepting chemotaxis protein
MAPPAPSTNRRPPASARRLPAFSLRAKIAAPIAIAVLGTVGLSLVARDAAGHASDALEVVNTTSVPTMRAAGDVGAQANRIVSMAVSTVAFPELPGPPEELQDAINDLNADFVILDEKLTADAARDALAATQEAATLVQDILAGKVGGAVGSPSNYAAYTEAMPALMGTIQKLQDVTAQGSITSSVTAGDAQRRAQTMLLVGLLLIAAVTGGTTYLVTRSINRSLSATRNVAEGLAAGDLTRRSGVTSGDEIGSMAVALDTAVEELAVLMRTIGGSSEALAAASEEMSSTSQQIAASADESATQAGVVSAAAEQVSRNVQTVAAGSEEMGASIREIAHNANEAARVAAAAVGVAEATNKTVTKLGDSSREIGDVVKVITSIAEQTNLLALNATIEAARAGEAGKGFAVVANEVKELAQETAKATEDISRRVEAIQDDSTRAVAAIGEISDVIGQINDFQLTIASAVEEQTATTAEMNRNVNEAAVGSGDIAANIGGVATAAHVTTQGVAQSQLAVEELARMSSELRGVIQRFTY